MFFLRKEVDFYLIAFISAIIYFSPGFYGYVLSIDTGVQVALHDDVYLIYIVFLLSVLLFAFLYTNVRKEASLKFKGDEYTGSILTFLAIIGLVGTFFSAGSVLFSVDKHEIIPALGRWHLLWVNSAGLALTLGYITGNKKIIFINLLLLLFNVYVGHRTYFVIPLIAIIFLHFRKEGLELFSIKNIKYYLLVVLFGFVVLAYKDIYILVKMGAFERISGKFSDPIFYSSIFITSEPFIIQTTLNEVVKSDFGIELTHLKNLLSQFILFSPELGIETTGFNSKFQSRLFPNIKFGMAGNILAEIWSLGGMVAISIFLMLFNLFIWLGNNLIKKSRGSLLAVISISMVYFTFYIHRSEMAYTIALIKRLFLLWVISLCLSYLTKKVQN